MLGQGRFSRVVPLLAGIVLILLALAMGRAWFDRHFLPSFAQSRAFQWHVVLALRAALALAGLLVILFVRLRSAWPALSVLLALVAGVAATELVLRTQVWRAAQEHAPDQEPLRRRDARLGWAFAPDHHGRAHGIDYATGAEGYRVPRVGTRTDFGRPTIVLAGESVMFGYGLDWPDTIQARLQALTGLQVANLAGHAYRTDQSGMRLPRELPRFARPRAVVILFPPFLLDRNLDRDRPHLDVALRWHAAEPPSLRLIELGRRLIRYRSAPAIDEGAAMTSAALRRVLTEASARG